jgi:hypothetical protein
LAAGVVGWAQGDTPIVVKDGSLTMQSKVPWDRFQGSGDEKQHPNSGGAITQVVVTIKGSDQTVDCTNQRCAVDVKYASTHIKISSGANGKGLRVSPFSAFRNGDTSDILVHKNQNAKISHVTVTKGNATAFDSAASRDTQVVIHYQ